MTIRPGAGPASRQLRAALLDRIQRGKLLPSDRIPTVRALADAIGLAPNTVAKAYRQLEAEGWLVGRGRAGTFVADRLPAPPDERGAALAEAASAYLRRARQLGVSVAAAKRMLDRV